MVSVELKVLVLRLAGKGGSSNPKSAEMDPPDPNQRKTTSVSTLPKYLKSELPIVSDFFSS